jgi:hypothetical protein
LSILDVSGSSRENEAERKAVNRRINILRSVGGDTTSSVFTTREVLLSPGSRGSPVAVFFNRKLILSFNKSDVTHLTPELSPRIADDPVFGVSRVVDTPANNGDDVINTGLVRNVSNTTLVVKDRFSVDTTGKGTTGINFLHHGGFTRNTTELSNRSVREGVQTDALATVFRESGASSASVHGSASPVSVAAETFRGIRRASRIAHAGIIRNITVVVNELVSSSGITTIARTSSVGTTVQDILDRKVDINTSSFTSDLNTISEGRHSTVSPARTAVLRNVLVEGFGSIANSSNVAPIEAGRESSGVDI